MVGIIHVIKHEYLVSVNYFRKKALFVVYMTLIWNTFTSALLQKFSGARGEIKEFK